MLGPLSKFKIPSLNVANNTLTTMSVKTGNTVNLGNGIVISTESVPDFVYNDQGVGYTMMFSPSKLGMKGLGRNGMIVVDID